MNVKNLFNLADNEYQFWKSFNFQGTEINFKHLNARKHTYTHPERDEHYNLYITISHHVFTVDSTKLSATSEVALYPHKPEDSRAFCTKRYALSFHLPQILETLPEQFCYHGGYSRYCTCKLKDENGNDIFYQVVFRVWKERGKMRFHVESAYPLPNRPSKIKKVNFWVICHNLLTGKKLPKPSSR
ncbi:heat-shock protein [Pseudoalteromonas sp. A601]|uniref:heat-shock protein n=1 Tax=Pseudoalteromonas sp. A601 TaxID=1967839 RepID=UPI000B3CEA0D|nr:heat-shock protein [Pseudoalteromonas sp. A601]